MIDHAPWSLIDAYQAGDRLAGQTLCRLNGGMLHRIVMANIESAPRVAYDDLYQQARIGVLVGFSKCKREKCTRGSPSHYALLWARAYVQQWCGDHGRDVRRPRRMQTEPALFERAQKKTPWAALTGVSLEDTVARLPDGREKKMLDVLAAESSMETERDRALFGSIVRELLRSLRQKPRDIICRRFGLLGHREHTFPEIGRIYGVSKQRVEQIARGAMADLRRAAKRRGFDQLEDLAEVA